MTTTRRFFGTDGVRGTYGTPAMDETLAARLGAAAAAWARARGAPSGARVLIGRDTRASGPALLAALARGVAAAGLTPVSLGIVPTPAVSLAVRAEGAPLGGVITASHNPAADNGLKFFGPGGLKLSDADEAAIEARLPAVPAPAAAAGPVAEADGRTGYVAACQALLEPGALRGWRVVLDTAHGATCGTSPAVLRALGAEVVGLGDAPDGANINAGVGSEHPAALGAAVRAHGARLGIAHDGDGDRCVLCDELGGVLDGDEILTLLALDALRRGRLREHLLVVTVQSNLGVEVALAAAGGRVVRTPVGDRQVIARMLADGAVLGGESSGHVICADVAPTGDGLVAALRVLAVMRAGGRPLSELRGCLRKFPQASTALVVRAKLPLETLRGFSATLREVEAELGARGRVLARYSGTEPKLRLLVEGPEDAVVRAALARLVAAAQAELGGG